jgi:hypothetical protein
MSRVFLTCMILACCLRFALAQDTVKVTTTLHEDGTSTVLTSNPSEHSAEAVTSDQGGKVRQKVIYTLDEQGQFSEGVVSGPKGEFLFKAEYKRDPANRLAEEIDYNRDGTLLRRFVYNYDANGKVTRIQAFDAAGNELNPTRAPKGPSKRRR